jgi:D-alanine-D-alanine ligase
MKVLMVYGGRSAEREISELSAAFVGPSLRDAGHEVLKVEIGPRGGWTMEGQRLAVEPAEGRWRILLGRDALDFDMVFPVLHGPFGEDGTVQGLCETAGWPYAGAGVATSALCMDKVLFRRVMEAYGLPLVDWAPCLKGDLGRAVDQWSGRLPVFVKPARLGSSVGITRADSPEALRKALVEAASFDPKVLVEKAVEEAREIEVSVLGEESGISAAVPGEILPGREWYDYRAKYHCPESELVIPARLPDGTVARLQRLAELAFAAVDGIGFARVDFLLSGGGRAYLNEINTIPGFTSISMFHRLWEAAGVPVEELMDRILRAGMVRPAVGLPEERR